MYLTALKRIAVSLNVQPIRDALNPILDTYLLSFTGLCTLLLPLSLSRSLDTGWLALYTAHCVAYCSVLLFTFVPLLARFRLVFIIAFYSLVSLRKERLPSSQQWL